MTTLRLRATFLCLLSLWVAAPAAAQIDPDAQNLVFNGEMELMIDCPKGQGEFNVLESWDSPSKGTPDYFNDCAGAENHNIGVPYNYMGAQHGHSGSGYAGFYAYYNKGSISNNYREYMRVRLTEPMKAGVAYCVRMFVSIAENSIYSLDDIQATFSSDKYSFASDGPVITNPDRAVNFRDTLHLADPKVWVQLCNYYMAQGGETYLYIGNMRSDDETLKNEGPRYMKESEEKSAYYYIDDVAVTKLQVGELCHCTQVDYDDLPELMADAETTPMRENIIDPIVPPAPKKVEEAPADAEDRRDVPVQPLQIQAQPEPAKAKEFSMSGELFVANGSQFAAEAQDELERILAAVQGIQGVKVIVSGHTNDQGEEDALKALSRARAKNVAFYLIDKGIDPSRVFYFGYGSRKPIADNTTPEGQKLNERVEIKVTNQ